MPERKRRIFPGLVFRGVFCWNGATCKQVRRCCSGRERLETPFFDRLRRQLGCRTGFSCYETPLCGKGLHRLLGTLFFNEALSNFVQVIGEHAQARVALKAVQTFVGAAIQTMVLQAVDV